MTEAEWLACGDPGPVLECLRGKASDRKLRLYCCACCRRVWDHLGRGRRRAVETAERYADGKAGWWGTLVGEFLALPQDGWESDPGRAVRTAAYVTVRLWGRGPNLDGVAAASLVARLTGGNVTWTRQLADLVREIFRHPDRMAALDARWRTADVLGLARAAYDGRAFDRLPILADALLDAGCDDEDILSHCRSEGPHVRGCWVVDLVLGKK